jgi:hypothetical protein
MTEFDTIPLPKPRENRKRVTGEMKQIKPGQSLLITDERTARSFLQWIRRRGTAVFTKEENGWRVGRVE